MARMARVVVANYPHHATQRGNRRRKTFFCDDDYSYYIDPLFTYTKEYGTEVWAYCLMPDHIHLAMGPLRRMVCVLRWVKRIGVVHGM